MTLKAIVFDLDNTLLNDELKISSSNIDSILNCYKNGMLVIICTARPLRSALKFITKELREISYIISLNGAMFNTPNTTYPKSVTYISFDECKFISYILSFEKDIYYTVEYDGFRFATNAKPGDKEFFINQTANISNIVPLKYGKPIKIFIDGKGKNIELLFKNLKLDGNPQINFSDNGTAVHIVNTFIDKGSSLLKVLDTLGVNISECISFGDDKPDISMLQSTGLGIAMGNSDSNVKELADVVIGCHKSDTISRVLSAFTNSIHPPRKHLLIGCDYVI